MNINKRKHVNIATGRWVEVMVRVLVQLLLFTHEVQRKRGYQIDQDGEEMSEVQEEERRNQIVT